MSSLSVNLQRVKERIESASLRRGRDPNEILLVAVTKTVSPGRIQEAIREGLTHFGENYIQEAQKKIEEINRGTWHFIGHLQKNKVKPAVNFFSMIETLDSIPLARALNRAALEAEKTLEVLIQVNEAEEKSKSGLSPNLVPTLLEASPEWPALHIRGFMTIPPFDPDPEKSRPWYQSLFRLQQKWQDQFPELDLSHISMGMSNDFEVAIEEGTTIIRVGTALFGERP